MIKGFKLSELNGKARSNAGDIVLDMMKDHKDQYLSVTSNKLEKYSDDNGLKFDVEGNLI